MIWITLAPKVGFCKSFWHKRVQCKSYQRCASAAKKPPRAGFLGPSAACGAAACCGTAAWPHGGLAPRGGPSLGAAEACRPAGPAKAQRLGRGVTPLRSTHVGTSLAVTHSPFCPHPRRAVFFLPRQPTAGLPGAGGCAILTPVTPRWTPRLRHRHSIIESIAYPSNST